MLNGVRRVRNVRSLPTGTTEDDEDDSMMISPRASKLHLVLVSFRTTNSSGDIDKVIRAAYSVTHIHLYQSVYFSCKLLTTENAVSVCLE